MGWASGSRLAESVWSEVERHIPPDAQQRVARRIIDLFENHDADDWDHSDALFMAAYPTPFPANLPRDKRWQDELWDEYFAYTRTGGTEFDEWYQHTRQHFK